jgi:hypothetical protein
VCATVVPRCIYHRHVRCCSLTRSINDLIWFSGGEFTKTLRKVCTC